MQERAHQFLPYNSSGINLFGKRTVQADSCVRPEQVDTLFVSVGVRKGDLGGGWSFWAGGPNFTRYYQDFFNSSLFAPLIFAACMKTNKVHAHDTHACT